MFVKTCYLHVGYLQLLFRRASCSSVLKDAQTWLHPTDALLWSAYTSQLWFGSVEEQGKSQHEPAYFGWMETSVPELDAVEVKSLQ